ncbi:MAG: sodium ion-translocating decarboxylase subunit beta [Lachnospiraceae bacterium]|nr:sodium ion-translocating decarboxylase subunit beta [Lachnospiraceae bacterium]
MGKFIQTTGFYMLFSDFAQNGWKTLIMLLIGLLLLWLAIHKKFEPLLLMGIALGVLITNLPGANLYHSAIWDAYTYGCPYDSANDAILYDTQTGTVISPEDYSASLDETASEPHIIEEISFTDIVHYGGLLDILYIGVKSSLYPCIIFIGIGAMTDFGPLIANPISLLLGAAAQVGIFLTYLGCTISGLFTQQQGGAIGIIGGADGPTAIYTASKLAPELLGAIAIAAYSYMALVPVIQPPIMKLLTTKEERCIVMKELRPVSQLEKILFPIMVIIFVSLLVPSAAPLICCLMFGNLLTVSGVTERLSKTAQNELMNIVTLFLGISVGATATAERFLTAQTLGILVMGVAAFAMGTASGVLLAKFMNLFLKNKINPLIGSAGVSAVPMAARVSQKVGQQEDPSNFLLMHAMGPNVAGVIGSAIAAGVLISILG